MNTTPHYHYTPPHLLDTGEEYKETDYHTVAARTEPPQLNEEGIKTDRLVVYGKLFENCPYPVQWYSRKKKPGRAKKKGAGRGSQKI